MLVPAEIDRDEYGYWLHPTLADIAVDTPITDHPAAGMEFRFVAMGPDEGAVAHRYFEQGDPDITDWSPSAPDGEGWFVVAIYDTEDGPHCAFARPTAPRGEMEATCIGCGCTDSRACVTPSGPCSWLRLDRGQGVGVCSTCAEHVARWDSGERRLAGRG